MSFWKERNKKLFTFYACVSSFQMIQVIMNEMVFFTECHLGLWCEPLRWKATFFSELLIFFNFLNAPCSAEKYFWFHTLMRNAP